MDMTPSSMFEFFWDDEVISFVTEMTNLYALQKGRMNFHVTNEEVRGVFAILLLSGYVPLPSRRMYWDSNDDVRNVAVSSIMPLNRFEDIVRFLHFADNNNLTLNNKFGKVRPLFSMLNERFLQY
jgi:hypothetical protein